MRSQKFRRTFKWAGRIQMGSATVAGILPLSLKANLPDVTTHLGTEIAALVQTAQQWSWIAVPVLLALAFLLKIWRSSVGDPAIWETVQSILTNYRNRIFRDAGSPYQQDHRVTLFRHVRWTWRAFSFRIGWLIPVERSGQFSQSTKIIFRASDRANECEGVAGLAWSQDRSPYLPELPDVSAECSEDDRAEYSNKTNLPDKCRARVGQWGRSFYGIRVEVKGKPWGVIVIDSRDTKIKKDRVLEGYKFVGQYLESLLTKV